MGDIEVNTFETILVIIQVHCSMVPLFTVHGSEVKTFEPLNR